MMDDLERIIEGFRRRHPETKHWENDEVIEAMFFILVKQTYSVISLGGRKGDDQVACDTDLKSRRPIGKVRLEATQVRADGLPT
jgi:hypothetical protein